MTESASPRVSMPRITVLNLQPGDPPFRLVQIDGEVVAEATSMTDVLAVAALAGIRVHDLDDPEVIRWVGGGKFHWRLY
ncbi:hypothetical protein ACFU8Q_15140 [Streptomyces sp. NPDC057543]|uniref:hypothetical protein n=1 Tax=Streptomyces sp. NPDC057543 TaxID=3346163 RepID=UPI0036A7840B